MKHLEDQVLEQLNKLYTDEAALCLLDDIKSEMENVAMNRDQEEADLCREVYLNGVIDVLSIMELEYYKENQNK